ncbi:hypothetical protein BDV11DRAFT_189014 [Aspergillus similis]
MSGILVTGSSRGLGLELVKQLSSRVSVTGGLDCHSSTLHSCVERGDRPVKRVGSLRSPGCGG